MKQYITFAIMLSLLSGKKQSAKELASKFETSTKTIYRCVELLLEAGMPIVSQAGKNGGYELLKESVVPPNFFSTKELDLLNSIIKGSCPSLVSSEVLLLNEKIENMRENSCAFESESAEFVIDTLSWGAEENGKNLMAEKIKNAISSQNTLEICYNNEKRQIEPYTLVFKGGAWYVYANCLKRLSFRLFKISRIKELTILENKFERKNINTLSKPWNKEFKENFKQIDLKIECYDNVESEVEEWLKSPLIENVGNKKIVSGEANFSFGLVHKLMEFGNKIKVLSPQNLKTAIVNECNQIKSNYQ